MFVGHGWNCYDWLIIVLICSVREFFTGILNILWSEVLCAVYISPFLFLRSS